jgi:hypothetical protein
MRTIVLALALAMMLLCDKCTDGCAKSDGEDEYQNKDYKGNTHGDLAP